MHILYTVAAPEPTALHACGNCHAHFVLVTALYYTVDKVQKTHHTLCNIALSKPIIDGL